MLDEQQMFSWALRIKLKHDTGLFGVDNWGWLPYIF